MRLIHTAALAAAAALAAGAGISYAQQGAAEAPTQRQITTYAVWGHTDVDPGQVVTARTDDCPAGQLVTGGGGFLAYRDPGAFVMSASSIAWNHGPKGWYVSGRSNATERTTLYTYGLCTDAVTALPPLNERGLPPGLPQGFPPGLAPGAPGLPEGR
ncbi:hypothetical protein ACFCV9_12315 [Streptomyces sp. NPDC056367]|uniref:hypothetical protein n=1 Tax=unclassified Streptomyces TaxID=2593676 RepID=UPI0035E1DE6B